MAKPRKTIDPAEYYRVAVAAKLCGVNRTTLLSAIERDELPAQLLGCALPIVRLVDVQQWAGQVRTAGRPPGKKPPTKPKP
jgi:hypothetical protein